MVAIVTCKKTDLVHLPERTFDRKRILTYFRNFIPNLNPKPNS